MVIASDSWHCAIVGGETPPFGRAVRSPIVNHQAIQTDMYRFLSRLDGNAVMERNPYFVQVADLSSDRAETLCQLGPLKFDKPPSSPEHIIVRGERQTFRRLPKSGAIVFGVKTTLRPLTALSVDELDSFQREVRGWPEVIATYKGRHCWGPCTLDYCDAVLQRQR